MPAPKKKGRTGRPSKLTPKTQAAICDAIEAGCTYEAAASEGGVTDRSLYSWLERGLKATKGKHRAFLQEVQRARSRAERRLVTRVEGGAEGWKGAAWILERRWRDGYGRKAQEERRCTAELRKLEAEADLAQAKAQLARDQSKAINRAILIDLDDDDGNGLTDGITAADLAAASPTPVDDE